MPIRVAFLMVCAVTAALGQGFQCIALSSSPIVHAEGVTERVGDITMNCSGGQPNQPVTGNLNIFLSVNLTNRLTAGAVTDIVVSIDNGAGPVNANVPAVLAANNQAVFNGLSFTLSSQGSAVIRIQNVRANATQTRGGSIQMQLAFNGSNLSSVFTSQFTVGIPLASLLGSSPGRLICSSAGSPYPSYDGSFVALAAGGASVSTFRVTEGFASSFSPKSDQANFQADSGVRFIFKYSGFPAGARIYVPDVVVGTDGTVPTSAGDMGLPLNGGVFTAGSSALLLSRVLGSDSSGAGGFPTLIAPPPGTGAYSYDTAREVSLDNGTGFAVFEVISADQFSLQNAQIQTFLTLPAGTVGSTFQTQLDVSLAALSSSATASNGAVPRFIQTTPANDCVAIGDCGAPYFPALNVTVPNPLKFSVNAGGGSQPLYLPITNAGGGVLFWTASVTYAEVSGWLQLDPASGFNNSTIRVNVLPAGLSPGIYNASIRINAGVIGTAVVPVQINVSATPVLPAPTIRSVTNAANASITAIVAGSRAAINGDSFNAQNLLVALDGNPVAILEQQRTRLLILVPGALAGKSTAVLTISAAGTQTASFVVNVADVAPAILPGGVLNLDYSVNSANAPAIAGSAFQVFATGLPLNGTITGRVHDIDIFQPLYAGPAPGAIGIQQVNLQIHPAFLTFQTFIYVCGQVPNGSRICSPAVPIWLQAQ